MTSQQPSATSRSPEKKDISGMPAMEGSGSVRGTRAAALAEEEGGGKNGKPRMKRPPSLSDIAARMKLDQKEKEKDPGADKDGLGLASAAASSEGRPRLGLTGRLNSSADAAGSQPLARQKSGNSDVSDDGAGGVTAQHRHVQPSPLARGEPPSAAGSTSVSGSASAASSAKEQSLPPAGAPRIGTSGMPSLQAIRDRMSKKGFAMAGGAGAPGVEGADKSAATKAAEEQSNGAKEDAAKREQSTPASLLAGNSNGVSPAKEVLKPEPVKAVPETAPAPAIATSSEDTKAKADQPLQEASAEGKPKQRVHPLQHKWTLYYDSKTYGPGSTATTPMSTPHLDPSSSGASSIPGSPFPPTPTSATAPENWEAALKMLGVYTTVEAFFGTFATLRRPSQLERNANYHLFKNGIKPMWEDPANANGGKWTITLRGTNPALLDRSWMWLVLALIGEELDENDSITGAVCSTRAKGDRIALWVRHKNEVDVVNRLGRRLVHLLDVEKEPGVSLEFQFMMGQPTAPARYISIHNPPVAGTPGGQQHGGSPAGGSRSGYGRRGSEQLGPAPGAYGQHQNQYGGGIGLGLGGPIGRATHSPGSGVVGLPGPGALGVGGGVGLGGLIGRTHSPGPPAGTGGSGTLSGGVPLGHKAAAIPEPKRSGPGGNGAA